MSLTGNEPDSNNQYKTIPLDIINLGRENLQAAQIITIRSHQRPTRGFLADGH